MRNKIEQYVSDVGDVGVAMVMGSVEQGNVRFPVFIAALLMFYLGLGFLVGGAILTRMDGNWLYGLWFSQICIILFGIRALIIVAAAMPYAEIVRLVFGVFWTAAVRYGVVCTILRQDFFLDFFTISLLVHTIYVCLWVPRDRRRGLVE